MPSSWSSSATEAPKSSWSENWLTSFVTIPAGSLPDVKAGGYASFKDFQKRWLPNSKVQKFNELQEQRDSWQALLEVPMHHNRLIVYKGHYFHSISNVFGDTPENGRLVQLFFFEVPD